MGPAIASVPASARLRMAHGVLELTARAADAPLLHIKGVALHEELARGRLASTDCDVLVRPDRVEALCAALEAAGWQQVTRFEHGSVFTHAATFHHQLWGTVDVHRFFPGLDVDPLATFGTLWVARSSAELGGVDCPVPSLDAQRLLLLVHAARDRMARSGHDVEVSWTQLDPEARGRVDALAAELGATVPLALATGRPERARGGRQEHLWRAMHEGADGPRVRLAMLRDVSSPCVAASLLGHVVRVNPDHLALRLGRPPTRQELRHEWWRRWGRWARSAGMPRRARS